MKPSLAAVPWQPYLCNLRSEQDAGLGGCLFWPSSGCSQSVFQVALSGSWERGTGPALPPSFLGGLGRHSQNIDFGSLSHRLVELPLSIVGEGSAGVSRDHQFGRSFQLSQEVLAVSLLM